MPTYSYRCTECAHQFETVQRITEDPIQTCPACGLPGAKRLINSANFILKGSGWYADHYSGGSNRKAQDKDAATDKPADKAPDKDAATDKPTEKATDASASKPTEKATESASGSSGTSGGDAASTGSGTKTGATPPASKTAAAPSSTPTSSGS